MFAWDSSRILTIMITDWLMLKVKNFETVDPMILCFSCVCHLIGMVISVIGKSTATYQGIVTIVKIYSDHAQPCVRSFCLILIHRNTAKVYAWLIYKYYWSLFTSI